jgi:Cu2+-exporting ATPase
MVGMGKGAKNGILIKDSESLEIAHRINVVILDKTGTLTEGKPMVTDLVWTQKKHTEVHKSVLYSMERRSAHPLASSIVGFMGNNLSATLQSFEYIAGKGIKAAFKNIHYFAGNPMWIMQVGPTIADADKKTIETLQEEGKTVVLFTSDTELLAIIALADPLKAGSAEAVQQLRKKNIEVHMLTGDHERTAQAIAKQTGISSFRAHMLPGDKADYIKELQSKGKIVAMVGDGINDAQAMAESQIAIAMGKGSDVAMDVAGITIISSDLTKIPLAIKLSDQTIKTVYQNLFWAFIYNAIGIPIAAGILYPIWGFMLNPMFAAAAMALSSVSVVANSLRLAGKKL